jgi:hypothetical protein
MRPLRLVLILAATLLAAVPAGGAVAARPHARSSVQLGDSQYGRLIVDRAGRTLYLFTREHTGRSACYGACNSAASSTAAPTQIGSRPQHSPDPGRPRPQPNPTRPKPNQLGVALDAAYAHLRTHAAVTTRGGG